MIDSLLEHKSAGPNRGTTLLDLTRGESATIVAVRLGHELFGQLMGMGLFAGAKVTALQVGEKKPLLLSVGETRIAMGRDLARAIFIEKFPASADDRKETP